VRTEDEGGGDGVDGVRGDGEGETRLMSRWEAGNAEACRGGTCC